MINVQPKPAVASIGKTRLHLLKNVLCQSFRILLVLKNIVLFSLGIQVEITDETETQCYLPPVPLTSTPICSPVKSFGGRSAYSDNDVDYIPPADTSFDEMAGKDDEIEDYNEKYGILLEQEISLFLFCCFV